jgi:hypothetical protein
VHLQLPNAALKELLSQNDFEAFDYLVDGDTIQATLFIMQCEVLLEFWLQPISTRKSDAYFDKPDSLSIVCPPACFLMTAPSIIRPSHSAECGFAGDTCGRVEGQRVRISGNG